MKLKYFLSYKLWGCDFSSLMSLTTLDKVAMTRKKNFFFYPNSLHKRICKTLKSLLWQSYIKNFRSGMWMSLEHARMINLSWVWKIVLDKALKPSVFWSFMVLWWESCWHFLLQSVNGLMHQNELPTYPEKPHSVSSLKKVVPLLG